MGSLMDKNGKNQHLVHNKTTLKLRLFLMHKIFYTPPFTLSNIVRVVLGPMKHNPSADVSWLLLNFTMTDSTKLYKHTEIAMLAKLVLFYIFPS